jgi:hypothetical protein
VAPRLAEAGLLGGGAVHARIRAFGIPRDGDNTIRALRTDAVALHRPLGGDGRITLLGHDCGAITAAGLAGDADSPTGRWRASLRRPSR